MNRKKYGIMGGSFDPIHNGHLLIANEVLEQYKMEKIIFIPAGNPPHKDVKAMAAPSHRYAMTELAIATNDKFVVSDIEIKKSAKSYAIDTIRELTNMYPTVEFYFITGIDAILELDKWRDTENLLKLCKFIAVNRPGYCYPEIDARMKEITNVYYGHIESMEVPMLQISSTDIRDRISRGKSPKYLIPEDVERYIMKNNLYMR